MSARKRTAAKLLSLDNALQAYIDEENPRIPPSNQQETVNFALDFIPSVFSWWIDKCGEPSWKQLSKIEEIYQRLELDDFEDFLDDDRIKSIGIHDAKP